MQAMYLAGDVVEPVMTTIRPLGPSAPRPLGTSAPWGGRTYAALMNEQFVTKTPPSTIGTDGSAAVIHDALPERTNGPMVLSDLALSRDHVGCPD